MTLLWLYWGALAVLIVGLVARAIWREQRRRVEEQRNHAEWMNGVAWGAQLDERERREANRRRLFG